MDNFIFLVFIYLFFYKEHLHRRLEEIEKLPSMLAEAQRDYEKEKSMRTQLEHELQSRLEMIESLVYIDKHIHVILRII